RTDTGAQHQVKVIMEGLAARAVRYHEQHKLGIYRKAKLANVFKWKLTEIGYSKPFVERATQETATRLALDKECLAKLDSLVAGHHEGHAVAPFAEDHRQARQDGSAVAGYRRDS